QAEEPLLEDRVAPVPQRDREAQPALAVADPEESILTPAVGAAAGVIVREGLPGGPLPRVVLADGPPLAVGEVGAPALPVLGATSVFLEPQQLGTLDHRPSSGCASVGRAQGPARGRRWEGGPQEPL